MLSDFNSEHQTNRKILKVYNKEQEVRWRSIIQTRQKRAPNHQTISGRGQHGWYQGGITRTIWLAYYHGQN